MAPRRAGGIGASVGEPESGGILVGERGLTLVAEAILARQTADGALPLGFPGEAERRVVPYFADLAALGLVAAFRATGETRFQEAVRRWALWRDVRCRPDGAVDDFLGREGAWRPSGQRDSTDSDAALSLERMAQLFAVDRDFAFLRGRRDAVERAVGALALTLQPSGLTLAKPDHPVLYVTGNIEGARGWAAAARLTAALGDPIEAGARRRRGLATLEAIERELWDPRSESYRVGVPSDSDLRANLMAVGWLPASGRRKQLYAHLVARFRTEIPVAVRDESELDRAVWWGWAAAGAGDRPRLAALRLALDTVPVDKVGQIALLGHAARLLAGEPPWPWR